MIQLCLLFRNKTSSINFGFNYVPDAKLKPIGSQIIELRDALLSVCTALNVCLSKKLIFEVAEAQSNNNNQTG